MPQDLIDVIVASHDPRRPLDRTLRSALGQRGALTALGAELQVTVVCHNREVAEIAEGVAPEVREQVRWLHLADGIYSPAGPINQGIAESPGTWLSTVGSDDTLAEGALAAWYARGRAARAAAVIPPIRVPAGIVRTPLLRPGRRAVLDPVADHLAYRTAPLGLLRTDVLRRIGFAYTEARLVAGSDIEPGLRLWFRGGRITYAHGAPAYTVSEEMGAARVTSTIGPVARETGWLPPLLAQDWLREASRAEREEIATKLARTQIVNAVGRRATALTEGTADVRWTAEDAAAIGAAMVGLGELAGGLRALSRAEVSLLRAASRAEDPEAVQASWTGFRTGPASGRVLPPRLRNALHRSARPRLFLGQQLAGRTGTFEA